ncbi:MAG: hypothetical protein P8176_07690 [Gammaproteobacteria bacterium]
MTVKKADIENIVSEAIEMTNLARENDQKIPYAADTALYGPNGHLDSMGLVAFLIDIEERFMDQDIHLSLSDERAMSQAKSPFRSIHTLIDYIDSLIKEISS